jgi:hypothetical protein
MGTTPIYALPYPAAADPADVPTDMQELADRIELMLSGYGTSLPASPVNGQLYVLVDSLTNPSYQWHFRYNAQSTSAYKWEFIGGAPAYARVDTSEATSSASYVALATAGPSVTVPRAGDYMVTVGNRTQAGAGSVAFHSFDVGATAANDLDAAASHGNAALSNGIKTSRKNGVAASAAIVSKYKTTGPASTFLERWLEVLPVRVS